MIVNIKYSITSGGLFDKTILIFVEKIANNTYANNTFYVDNERESIKSTGKTLPDNDIKIKSFIEEVLLLPYTSVG